MTPANDSEASWSATDPSDAMVALWEKARAYVRRKGWSGDQAEDLVSEMMLKQLEGPDTPHSLHILYLQSRDRLDPRTWQPQGRVRRSSTFSSLDAPSGDDDARTLHDTLPAPQAETDPWTPRVLARLLRRLPPSTAQLLRAYYLEGLSEAAIGARHGLSESRVSQRLHLAHRQLTHLLHLERRRHAR